MKTGFEPGSEPVFEPPRRVMHKTLPGIFPSTKVKGGYVRTKSPLMMDGLYHLDTNPDIVRILPYPIRIEYPSNQDQSVFGMRDHTFQMGVELRNGERIYIDYEPYNIQLERPWIADRTANLVQVTRNELGANYAVLDERTIYIQPRFSNLKVMWAHLHVSDDEALMAVRRAVQIVDLPTTISAVRRQVKVSGIKFEVLVHERPNRHLLEKLSNEKGVLIEPSDHTLQRRLGAIDKFQKALWRRGVDYARKKFNIYITQALPDHPLDIVDVDFTPIDIVVIDDERPIIYGRPHLIAFRDRKTGSLLGYSISFKGASFEHFLEGLMHAISPKDMSQYPGLEWKQYGTFRRLGVDNDMALINDHARESLAQLGIQLIEYRPGHPWEKGAVERLFQTMNQDIIHNLPRSAKGGPKERDTFADKNADLPMLRLSELNEFIIRYICSDYHVNPHKGLGMLRTLDGIPNQLWDDGIRHSHARRPIDPDVITRMIGNTKDVSVRDGCVRWDDLIYCHPDLIVVQADAQNRTAVPGVQSTKYKAWRNPSNLERIFLLNHHTGQIIEVPVQEADAWYAKGLRLYQHQKVMAYLKEQNRNARDFESAYNDFTNKLEEINKIRVNRGARQQLLKFHARATNKYRRTRVVEIDHNDPSGAVPMSLSAVATEIPTVKPVSPAPRPMTSPAPDVTPPLQEDGRKYSFDLSQDDDDISNLFKRKDDNA